MSTTCESCETQVPVKTDVTDAPAPTASAPTGGANRYAYAPRVDIHEDAQAFYLDAELPGVNEKSVDVKLEEGTLTILGSVTPPSREGYKRTYAEYETGNFERSFRINGQVDAERIEATLRHGILHVTLPKSEAVKPRRIAVKVA